MKSTGHMGSNWERGVEGASEAATQQHGSERKGLRISRTGNGLIPHPLQNTEELELVRGALCCGYQSSTRRDAGKRAGCVRRL